MKIAIDIGHNVNNDTGAVGIKPEDELTMAVGLRLMELLRAAKHHVIECLPESATNVNDSLKQRVKKANIHHANIFVSIHFNAFYSRAYGAEVYAVSRIGKGIGREVLDEICKLGFYDRGVKSANLYVLRKTQMPAILVECCFCDNKADMGFFDVDKMAIAICKGLIGEVPDLHIKTPGMLVVHQDTYLKPSTEQSIDLPEDELIKITKGKHKLLDFCPEEEGHYLVELEDIGKKFIYAGHCRVKC